MNWTSRNYRPILFLGIRERLIRCLDQKHERGRFSWAWKEPLLWDAYQEASSW